MLDEPALAELGPVSFRAAIWRRKGNEHDYANNTGEERSEYLLEVKS
jgi:hypothetical protein